MLARLHAEPSNLWRGLHNDMEDFLSIAANRGEDINQWVPSIDVIEQEDKYLLRADVPGVDPQNIDILFEEGVLTIKGERTDHAQDEHQGYQRIERSYGSFQRSFRLPDAIDADNITASSNHGVLEVYVPKQEKLARKIEIKSE